MLKNSVYVDKCYALKNEYREAIFRKGLFENTLIVCNNVLINLWISHSMFSLFPL